MHTVTEALPSTLRTLKRTHAFKKRAPEPLQLHLPV